MPTKILIGSVLKPVDDVRHYHKIAKSLAKKDTAIHVFGYPSNSKSELSNIIFHSPKPFKRISFGRIYASIHFLILGLKLNPKIIICSTHELLKASVQIKILTGAKIIYDVQENYYSNIINTAVFPRLLKYPIAWFVRANEYIQTLFVSHFLLAERCYQTEIPFLKKGKYTVLENKLQAQVRTNCNSFLHNTSNFIITGTLGQHYGTSEGIDFFKKLNIIKQAATLSISGVCRDKELKAEIRNLKLENITVSENPIPHSEIIKTIEKGGIALLPYRPNKSTKDRIPTKFYEYLYYKTPMIIQQNEVWEEFLKPYNAAIFIDFNNYNVEEVIKQIESFNFYSGKEVGDEILWESERNKLLNIELINKL